jgi:cyclophilin family peptidyl-prolyl cis-trans isomerase
MRTITFLLQVLFLTYGTITAQNIYPDVVLQTTEGDIILRLYDNTSLHSQNFVKLVNEGYYNNQLFHRVIKNFMIQSGDPTSKNAKTDTHLGTGGPNYTIPPELNPMYFHKKGALAAARLPDNVNPKKESSGSQFYIVVGQIYPKSTLDNMVKNGRHAAFAQEEINAYTTIGGTPHLDLQYTVFGEVLSGQDIVDKISNVQTDPNNRPLKDIRIIKAYTKKK